MFQNATYNKNIKQNILVIQIVRQDNYFDLENLIIKYIVIPSWNSFVNFLLKYILFLYQHTTETLNSS